MGRKGAREAGVALATAQLRMFLGECGECMAGQTGRERTHGQGRQLGEGAKYDSFAGPAHKLSRHFPRSPVLPFLQA
jgi:hypothetical protein